MASMTVWVEIEAGIKPRGNCITRLGTLTEISYYHEAYF